MAEHDRAIHVELVHRAADQARLRGGTAAPAARPLAVAISRPVDGDDAIALGRFAHQSAQHEVLDHAAQPVQQDQRRPRPLLDIVQAHALDGDEAAERRMPSFRLRGPLAHDCGCHAQYCRGAAHPEEGLVHACVPQAAFPRVRRPAKR